LLVCVLGVGLIRAVPPVLARPAAAMAVLLCVATGVNAARHHRRFDLECGPFDTALAAIPPGRRVLALMYENKGSVLALSPYLHFGQYYMVRRGGATSGSLAESPTFPVRALAPLPHPD